MAIPASGRNCARRGSSLVRMDVLRKWTIKGRGERKRAESRGPASVRRQPSGAARRRSRSAGPATVLTASVAGDGSVKAESVLSHRDPARPRHRSQTQPSSPSWEPRVNYLQGTLNWAFVKQGAAQFTRKACCMETVLCFKILIRLIFACKYGIGDARRLRGLWAKAKPSPPTMTPASTRGHLHLASA